MKRIDTNFFERIFGSRFYLFGVDEIAKLLPKLRMVSLNIDEYTYFLDE